MELEHYDNDCEAIFFADLIEKKKTGRGAFGKTSCTRKRNGGMPSDFLTGRKLKEYMGNSEVKTYNLSDAKNIAKGKFGKKTTDEDDAKICELYSEGVKVRIIAEQYNISLPVVYKILEKYGIAKRNSTSKSVSISENHILDLVDKEMRESEISEEQISVEYKWEYEHLQKKFSLLEAENERYKIALLNLALKLI